MGQLRLDVPGSYRPPEKFAAAAYVCGMENIPWEGRVQFDGRRISIDRPVDESGKVSIPWHAGALGARTLQTCSLRMGEAAYNLPLELARGSCHRVRMQADTWQRSGLRLPPEYHTNEAEGTERLLDAMLCQDDPDRAANLANEAIERLERAADQLCQSFSTQALCYRRENDGQLGTLCGAVLAGGPPPSGNAEAAYLAAFNAASVRLNWTRVESDAGELRFEEFDKLIAWCERHNLRICCGPLFEFHQKLLPHWLYLMEDDFSAVVDAVSSFISRAVQRYRGRVHLWHCAASLNTPGPLPLSEEQVMRLTVATIQSVRRADPRTPLLISVDQPWGEGLAKNACGISPFHFADALIRSELGLAGIGLELRLGYEPGGTLPRSTLDVSNQIDQWSVLGLPLLVKLAMPLGSQPDQSLTGATFLAEGRDDGERSYSQEAAKMLRLILAKQPVHGLFWEGWDAATPRLFPATTLLDQNDQPSELLEAMQEIKSKYLG